MKICDLPITFFSNSPKVRILLTAVGVKLPIAFQSVRQSCEEVIQSIELDVESLDIPFVHSKGKVRCGISICESPDALPFLLGLSDPRNPHLDYHVIVGAAVAESEEDLLAFSNSFDATCSNYSKYSSPCLFVFSSSTFNGNGLPACATQIPSNSSDVDVKRRVREGLIRCLMNYFFMNRTHYQQLFDDINKEKFIPKSICQVASICFMLGDMESSNSIYNRGIKTKNHPHFQSLSILNLSNKHLSIEADRSIFTRDLPSGLNSLRGTLSEEFCTSIMLDSKTQDKTTLIRTLLRIALRVSNNPHTSRFLICYAISLSERIYKHESFSF